MVTLIPKFYISIFCASVFLIIFFNKSNLQKITTNHENKFLALALLLSRIIPVFIVYMYYNFDAKSDVSMFYNWAQLAKKGAFVYRDFDSPYAPLFSYITAIPLYIYNSANTIVLLMVLIEVAILVLTYIYFNETIGKATSLFYSLLYLTLPATFILSVFGGQEDIWMWGIIVFALIIQRHFNDSFWVGIIFGLGMITTKVLFIFALPIGFILLNKKIRYLTGLMLIGLPSLFILVYFGGDSFLLPIQQANDPRNPNIWSIINPFFNSYKILGIKALNLIGLLSNVFLIIWLSLKAKQQNKTFNEAMPIIWVLSSCWIMIIQQSSLCNYCFVYLMPLLFYYSTNLKTILIILFFSIACSLQPPIWWGLKMPSYNSLNDLRNPLSLVEYLLEIFIIGCIFYFCKRIYDSLVSHKL